MNVAGPKEDLVVGDLCGSVVVDLGRETLRRVVLASNQVSGAVDRALNEGEQTLDRLTQSPVDRRTGVRAPPGGRWRFAWARLVTES